MQNIIQNTIKKLKSILPQSTDSAMVRHMKTRRLVRTASYTVLASMAVYALCFVFPPFYYSNNDTNAMTGTAIASDTTLSISVDNDVLSLDLSPVSQSGTFATTTTPATVYVTTNNITGYTLGIRTSTSSDTATKLINNIDECIDTPSSTKCSLPSLSSPVSPDTYAATTSTDLNNTWGYLPSKYNSEQNEDYLPAPTVGDLDIINITTGPNEVNTNNENSNVKGITDELVPDEYTINLGSRIDYTPYAGQYSGTLVLTAVGNLVPYSVSYDANKPAQAPATANVDNVPTAQTGNVSSGDTIAVLLSNKVPTIGNTNPNTNAYEYAGYVFTGWCDIQPNEDANTGYQTCPNDATLYQPGDTFGIDQTADNTQMLYAVWGAPATVSFYSNGLIYDNTAGNTQNTVQYIPTYEGGTTAGQRQNILYTGTYKTPAYEETDPVTNYIFKGWNTDQTATEATYVDEQAITENLVLNAGDTIDLYAIWNYATVITFDGNGNDEGNTPMADITIEAGQTVTLPQNTYTKDGYIFNSWNTVETPTEQDPGETYADQADYTAGSQSADVTLYAQWVEPPKLYDYVKALVKKSGDTELTQSATDLQASITAPTTTDPATDTSNSGVYKYDATTFGAASDADSSYNIYYYRGILEPTADNGSYGSDGKATTYPNYVRLGNNTCWRIVRTTGSGGVKMVYNGVWNTTSNTCANATTAAQTGTSDFNSSNNNAIYVGYTYNNAMVGDTDTSTSVDTVFGNNTDTTLNNTRSNIKTYIEDTWYTSKMMTGATDNYVSLLEPSAGYCNDRTVYDTSWNALTDIIPQQNVEIRFGARKRVGANGNKIPSLTCPRGDVDLYRYVSTTSTTAFTSNELRHPAALLTADEVSLAGSGWSGILPYNAKSFLNSGSSFWLLSPNYRYSNGGAGGFFLYSSGNLNYSGVFLGFGVRPAISLKPGTTVASGEGTATDPWLINE